MVLPEVGRGQSSGDAVVFLFSARKNPPSSFTNTPTVSFFIPSESQKMLGSRNKRPVFV